MELWSMVSSFYFMHDIMHYRRQFLQKKISRFQFSVNLFQSIGLKKFHWRFKLSFQNEFSYFFGKNFLNQTTVCKPIFVDRDNLNSKNFVMNEIKKRAEDLDYPQVAIFPEGTLTNSRALMTFKPGAFGSGSAVQPIVLRFSGWNTYSWTFGQNPTNLG